MTTIVEFAAGMVKAAATVAAPTAGAVVSSTVPALAAEVLVEPVKTAAESLIKPAVEAARPVAELGKAVSPAITADVLREVPPEAGLSMLARGFFSETKSPLDPEAFATVLTPREMGALASFADIAIDAELVQNPVFAKEFSHALQQKLRNSNPDEPFSLFDTIRKSLTDAVEAHAKRDNKDLETIQHAAVIESIKRKMHTWRESTMANDNLNDDEKAVAMEKIDTYEQKLILEAALFPATLVA